MLEKLKLKLNITGAEKDSLLNLLIEEATQEIKDFTHQTTLPESLDSAIRDIVIIRYNRLGSEGLSSESYSGVSQSYLDDLPKDLKRKIRSYRRLAR